MDQYRDKGLIGTIVLLFFIFNSVLSAEIYQWVDADGNIHFTDKSAAAQHAEPVQLKSTINSYDGSSLPTFESIAPPKKKTATRTNTGKLPRLRPRQVIMYSTRWCGFCKKAKAYFTQKGIAYSERDIETSPQAQQEYQSYGGGGVPLILVGNKQGTQKLSGFSVARFTAAYK